MGAATWADVGGFWVSLALLAVAVATAVVGVRTLTAARDNQKQAVRDRITTSRPYAHAELVPSLWGVPSLDLRIVNTGLTAARSLTMEFAPTSTATEDLLVAAAGRFLSTKRTLAPRASLRTAWRMEAMQGEHLSDPKPGEETTWVGMPKEGVLRLRYSSDEPTVMEPYTDEYELHPDDDGMWPVPEVGSTPSTAPGTDAKYLRPVLEAIAKHIGELRR